ncbi:phosphate carrier protein, mitochondrial-like [Monodelphis domestica]|uniref:phosphate carrier protein, mitochondrial-like n=1 Tax=Monodelphis domestica TaxID=13616 RepID=UPI0000F2BC15|nr:phosphate carrier protein, mitochondrial-like [Monodelphis domestica]XP_056671083.1 phosphate carrier protein, mitochondrial-like [Monodelphis domestica]
MSPSSTPRGPWTAVSSSPFLTWQRSRRPRGDRDSPEYGSAKYLALCGLSGGMSTGLSHTMVLPLDLIKCRLQVAPTKYPGLVSGFSLVSLQEGMRGMTRGWAPTLLGFSMQGFVKFSLYEMFKHRLSRRLSEEGFYVWRTAVYMLAATGAGFFASLVLLPMDIVKMRMQTQPNFPGMLRQAMPKVWSQEGPMAFYRGLGPLWMRQMPYTVVKFACYERTLEMLYKYAVAKPQCQCSLPQQLAVTFVAGYVSGILGAIVSHPADTAMTILSKENYKKNMFDILQQLGPTSVWNGLSTRILMIGTLSAFQWFFYNVFKVMYRLPRPPPPQMPESLRWRLEQQRLRSRR